MFSYHNLEENTYRKQSPVGFQNFTPELFQYALLPRYIFQYEIYFVFQRGERVQSWTRYPPQYLGSWV